MKESNYKYDNGEIIKDGDKIKILGHKGIVLYNEQLDCFDVYCPNIFLLNLGTLMGISKRMNIAVKKIEEEK